MAKGPSKAAKKQKDRGNAAAAAAAAPPPSTAAAAAADPKLDALLRQHAPHFEVDPGSGKVVCRLNEHAFPPRLDAVEAFVKGAKYAKLARRAAAEAGLQKYEPFIVQSANFPAMLYCALTGQLIATSLDAVQLHMRGKRFERAKARFLADEQGLKPEPTLESFGIKLPRADGEGEGDGDGDGDGEGIWVPEGCEEGGSGSGGEGEQSGSGGGDDSDGGDDAEMGADDQGGDAMEEDAAELQEEEEKGAVAKAAGAKKAKAKKRAAGAAAKLPKGATAKKAKKQKAA